MLKAKYYKFFKELKVVSSDSELESFMIQLRDELERRDLVKFCYSHPNHEKPIVDPKRLGDVGGGFVCTSFSSPHFHNNGGDV